MLLTKVLFRNWLVYCPLSTKNSTEVVYIWYIIYRSTLCTTFNSDRKMLLNRLNMNRREGFRHQYPKSWIPCYIRSQTPTFVSVTPSYRVVVL